MVEKRSIFSSLTDDDEERILRAAIPEHTVPAKPSQSIDAEQRHSHPKEGDSPSPSDLERQQHDVWAISCDCMLLSDPVHLPSSPILPSSIPPLPSSALAEGGEPPSTSNHTTTTSPPTTTTTDRANDPDINPLFSLRGQLERGEIKEAHVIEAREGSVIISSGDEAAARIGHRVLHRQRPHGEEPGRIRELEEMEVDKARKVGASKRDLEGVNGAGRKEDDDAPLPVKSVTSNGKGKGKAREPSLESIGVGGGMSPVEEDPADGPQTGTSSSTPSTTAYFESNRHPNDSAFSSPCYESPSRGGPPPLRSATSSPTPTPTSALSSSPTSLHHPTFPPPSLTFSNSSSPGESHHSLPGSTGGILGGSSIRRSQTAEGSRTIFGIPASPSPSTSSAIRSNSFPKSQRTRSTPSTSAHHPSFSESSPSNLMNMNEPSFFSPLAGPSSPSPSTMDDVEISIAAQAEVIRKERQTKRLEQEKAREKETGGGEKASAPMAKRRSTRLGSGDAGSVGGPAGVGAGVLVGNLIGQDHANYVLMYNMLTGIRIAVSSLFELGLVWGG